MIDRVRVVLAVPAAVAWLVAGCTSTGAVAPDVPQRLLADATCVTELAGVGMAIASGPGGEATAAAVLGAIHDAGSTVGPSVLTACAETLANAVTDAQGVVARAKQAGR